MKTLSLTLGTFDIYCAMSATILLKWHKPN